MLVERGILDETSAGFSYLGLLTEDVLEILKEDFPAEHRALVAVLRTRDLYQRIEGVMDESDLADWQSSGEKVGVALREELVNDASAFNKRLKSARGGRSGGENQRGWVPRNTTYIAPRSYTRRGRYPVAVLPGQYTDGLPPRYTPEHLFTLPLNTALMVREDQEEGGEGNFYLKRYII